MDAEARLRRFLLIVSAGALVGTILELLLEEHTESALQLVPFALAAIALIAVVIHIVAPRPWSRRMLRITMALLALGGIVGLYLHLDHNIAFEQEIRPGAGPGDVLWDAMHGASPLLAPGIMTLVALLAIAATAWERR